MGKLKWFLIIVGILVVFGILAGLGGDKNAPPVDDTPPIEDDTPIPTTNNDLTSRQFEIGFFPIPVQNSQGAFDFVKTFDTLEENGEFVLLHGGMNEREWNDFLVSSDSEFESGANLVYKMAEDNNLKVLKTIDAMDQSDNIGKLPSSFENTFADEDVRTALKNYAVRNAQEKPAYMAVFAEVNGYLHKKPGELDSVVSLVGEISDLVKAESPNTIITTTFQYEALVGEFNGESQWDIFEAFEDVVDVYAITTYPSPYFSPEEIPDNYYTQIKDHTNKPVIFAESGWPSEGKSKFRASEQNQRDFIARVPELTEDLDFPLWIWWFPFDWDGPGYGEFFNSMGLYSSDGNDEKPALSAWQEIYGKRIS